VSDLTPKALSRWIIAGTLLVAGSCAPVSEAAVGQPDPGLDNPQTERVLTFGYDAIKDRYLTDVTMASVAFEGMRGLSTIDPAISVEQSAPRRILLKYQDKKVGEYVTPANDDPQAWAGLVMTVARNAAKVSPDLLEAGTEKLYEAVFDATLAKLDIFSRYAGATEARDHRASRNGFGGIGVRYEPHDDEITLTEVMPETPAAEAHLEIGDRITHIDGHSVLGQSQDDITKLLRGPLGSPVALTMRRKDRDRQQPGVVVTLHRSLIVPPTVTLAMKDGIATIAISSFNQSTTHNVTESLRTAKATSNFKGVVLDLRGNPGGLLDQGVGVADLFMDHGRIVSTRGRNPASVQTYDAKPGDIGEDVPLVVLVDGKSASASEIVAAALQDSGRAVVVGTTSYGKGTVQTVLRLPNDGEMTLTWSRFHSPSGYALHGLGVMPTICTADDHAAAAALLAKLSEGHSLVPAHIAQWRATSIEEQDLRKSLRTACPAAKHADVALDMEIGRDLIVDRTLYIRALSLTAPVTTTASTAVRQPTTAH
jgi:carboxyl-terminal processing protease